MRHETLSEDPDLAQAIDDLLPIAADLRARSSRLLGMREDHHKRAAADHVRELYNRIALRGQRIGTSGPALVEILNAILDVKARRGRAAPVGETSRTLLNAATEALAREEAAHVALTNAQVEVQDATKHRLATEEACRSFGIARIVR